MQSVLDPYLIQSAYVRVIGAGSNILDFHRILILTNPVISKAITRFKADKRLRQCSFGVFGIKVAHYSMRI